MEQNLEAFIARLNEVNVRFQHMNIHGIGASAPAMDSGSQGTLQNEVTDPFDGDKPPIQSNESHDHEGEVVAPTEDEIARAQEHYGKVASSVVGIDSSKWASEAPVYQYEELDGEIAPRNEELERMLFQESTLSSAGAHLDNLTEFNVKVSGDGYVVKKLQDGFDDPRIHQVLRENIRLCNYNSPTPIQMYTIPAVLSDRDVFAVAQAGSGKTGAYLIPIISKICSKYSSMAAPRPGLGLSMDDTVVSEPLVIIISPTRELSIQIFDHCRRLCYRTKLRPCVVYGGGSIISQRQQLQKGCDILIGTPGRMGDFIRRGAITTRRVKYLVLDEADELVESSWDDSMNIILGGAGNSNRRMLMFSATFSLQARSAAARYLENDHVRITVGRVGSSHRNIRQNVMWIDEHQKVKALVDLLMSLPACRVMVFCNTVATVEAVDDELYQYRLPVTSIHSNRTQREREDALRAFQSSISPILITTDVCARGIDVKNVMHIVNFDLPSIDRGGLGEYVNRIGRTGRIGNQGVATSFFNSKNDDFGYDLAKLLLECGQELPDFMENFRPDDPQKLFEDDDEKDDTKLEVEFPRGCVDSNASGISVIHQSYASISIANGFSVPSKSVKLLKFSRGHRRVIFSMIPTSMDLQVLKMDDDFSRYGAAEVENRSHPSYMKKLETGSNVMAPALDGDYFQHVPGFNNKDGEQIMPTTPDLCTADSNSTESTPISTPCHSASSQIDYEEADMAMMTESVASGTEKEQVHRGLRWDGYKFVPIDTNTVGKYPQYEITCRPGFGLPTLKTDTETPMLAKTSENPKPDRRRKTPLPDFEPASEAKFVSKAFITTMDYTLPHFFMMPYGAVLNAPLTVSGLIFIKPGFTLPPGFEFTAGVSLPISTVIPAGTLIPTGTRISDEIELPGSEGLLALSPPQSPRVIDDQADMKSGDSLAPLSEFEKKRVLLEKLRLHGAQTNSWEGFDLAEDIQAVKDAAHHSRNNQAARDSSHRVRGKLVSQGQISLSDFGMPLTGEPQPLFPG